MEINDQNCDDQTEHMPDEKVQGILRETFILALLSSAVFRLQNHVSDFF